MSNDSPQATAAMSVLGGPPSRGRGRHWQLAVTAAVVTAAGWALATHRHTVDAGVDRLAVADRAWLLAAGAAALATWVCAALAQQGAVAERLPAGRLVAAQFGACAANHLLPAGVGASAVNLRFLTRCGVSTARSATALAVKAAVGGLVRCALAAVLLLASPRAPRLTPDLPRASLVIPVAGCLALAAAAGALSRPVRHRTGRAARQALADVRAVHGSRARACALWGGSLGFALVHAAVLVAVVRSLEVTVPAGQVVMAYLLASGAAVLLPTPGGLGSLDATLLLTLTAAGAPAAAALSAVFGYRLLTAWLPLLPGLLVLALLARRSLL
ncbi:lysylphosphatidylglycerol synthase domain-containing protein [Streptomyces sp. NPDC002588]|uniref:lysylphosphatidylglycerol synthase domain-containing protein n=1 Tax=Streptomyces sp. NPDC002588 TaxID=3154419 RepID=UPI00332C0B5E